VPQDQRASKPFELTGLARMHLLLRKQYPAGIPQVERKDALLFNVTAS